MMQQLTMIEYRNICIIHKNQMIQTRQTPNNSTDEERQHFFSDDLANPNDDAQVNLAFATILFAVLGLINDGVISSEANPSDWNKIRGATGIVQVYQGCDMFSETLYKVHRIHSGD